MNIVGVFVTTKCITWYS